MTITCEEITKSCLWVEVGPGNVIVGQTVYMIDMYSENIVSKAILK